MQGPGCTTPKCNVLQNLAAQTCQESEPKSLSEPQTTSIANTEASLCSNVRCEFLHNICGSLRTAILPHGFCNRLRCLAVCRVPQRPKDSSAKLIRIDRLFSVRAADRHHHLARTKAARPRALLSRSGSSVQSRRSAGLQSRHHRPVTAVVHHQIAMCSHGVARKVGSMKEVCRQGFKLGGQVLEASRKHHVHRCVFQRSDRRSNDDDRIDGSRNGSVPGIARVDSDDRLLGAALFHPFRQTAIAALPDNRPDILHVCTRRKGIRLRSIENRSLEFRGDHRLSLQNSIFGVISG